MRERVRFTVRQMLRRRLLGRYTLRASTIVIHVRHNTPDLNTLDEIFLQGHYQPPDAVRRVLDDCEPLHVLDLGANVGLFAASLLRDRPTAQVTCFEPDRANATLIRRSIEANRGLAWELVEAAAATEDGEARFSSGLFTASRVESGGGEVVAARDVFAFTDAAEYLKIDIEGAEWKLLEDPRFRSLRARVIALEYHPFHCPAADPGAHARRRLEQAGFRTVDAAFALPEGHGMVWAWKA